MKFGLFIRNCRDKLEWTQPEAALKIQIEQSYLSKLETGKSYPSEEVFDKPVEVYQINTESLFDKEYDDIPETVQSLQNKKHC